MLALRWVNARLGQSLKGYVRCFRGGKFVFFAVVCIIPVSGATSMTPTHAVTQNSAPMDLLITSLVRPVGVSVFKLL